MSMPAIGRMSERNLVGLCHLDVVAVEDVLTVGAEHLGNVANEVVLKEGKSWSRVYLEDAGGRFVEKWVLKGGDLHSEAEISGAIAKDRLALMPQLWRMKGKRYLVLFTTQNGDTLLMGRVETPAIALVSERRAGDAEQLQNDRNEYRVVFQLSRRHPVPFYEAPPPSETTPETPLDNNCYYVRVCTSGIAVGDILRYNGTGWVNEPLASITGGYVAEVPSGTVNGSNATFTTSSSFDPASVQVWVNGLLQANPTHYTTSGGNTILFTSSPETGDQLHVQYTPA